VVSLDGSDVAELALPPAQELARTVGSELVRLEVVPFPPYVLYDHGSAIAAFEPDKELADSEQYLVEAAARLTATGSEVRTRAELAQPAVAIAEVADQEKANLIVMATHGRSGFARLVLLQGILRHTPANRRAADASGAGGIAGGNRSVRPQGRGGKPAAPRHRRQRAIGPTRSPLWTGCGRPRAYWFCGHNNLAGIGAGSDSLPARFLNEPSTFGGSKGHVGELPQMLEEYYAARGWQNGVVGETKLQELEIEYLAAAV